MSYFYVQRSNAQSACCSLVELEVSFWQRPQQYPVLLDSSKQLWAGMCLVCRCDAGTAHSGDPLSPIQSVHAVSCSSPFPLPYGHFLFSCLRQNWDCSRVSVAQLWAGSSQRALCISQSLQSPGTPVRLGDMVYVTVLRESAVSPKLDTVA